MSRRTDDNIRLNFIINGDPARKQINEIDKEAAKLKTRMKGLKKDSKEYADTKKQLAGLTSEKKKLVQQIGVAGMTMRELNAEARRLRSIQANLAPGSKEFKKVSKELQVVNLRMKELRTGTKQTGISLNGMANSFNKYFGMVAGLTASFAGIIMGGRRAVEEFNNFEQAIASLSALTGLVGEELVSLGQQAAQMATSTVEGGVRITKSADEIVNAFMVMGSQRPELLKNAEALQSVTQDAMILAEASRMELEPAIRAVSMALNQYQLSADESRRVINTFAAGAQAGAGDVQYITSAVERAGTTMNMMNISLEESVGLIETLAPFYTQASEAGNTLDKTLLLMMQNNIGYQSGVFNIIDALDELEERFSKGERAVDIFGARHQKAATLLVQNRDEFLRYTDAVTASNTAIEQAITNTDTNMARLDQARNRYRDRLRELGGLLAPIMTFSTNFFSYMMKIVLELVNNWQKYREVIIALIATYVAYNAQALITMATVARANAVTAIGNGMLRAEIILKRTATAASLLYAAAKARLTGNTVRATAAMRAFRIAVAGTPWGLIAAGVTAVAAAIAIYIRRNREAVEQTSALVEAEQRAGERFAEQEFRIKMLTQVIENGNQPLERRRKAMEELNEILPEYNGYLDAEGKLYNHNKKELDKYITSLQNSILIETYEEEIKALIKQRAEITKNIVQYRIQLDDLLKMQQVLEEELSRTTDEGARSRIRSYMEEDEARMRTLRQSISYLENHKDVKAIDEEINRIRRRSDSIFQALTTTIDENTEAQEKNNETVVTAGELHDILKTKISDTEKAINDLSITARNAALNAMDTGDWGLVEAMQSEIAILKSELDNLKVDDIILDGIVKAGSVDSFLENLSDDEAAFIEEQERMNLMFLENWGDAKLESQSEINQRMMEAHIDHNSDLAEEQRRFNEEIEKIERERIERVKQFSIASFREITDAVMDIWAMSQQAKTDRTLQALNDQRDNALSNELLTEEQKAVIAEQYRQREAQIKRRAFIREKNAKLIESFINTALAITAALPDPFRVAFATIAGAAQSAVIASQPVPQYKKGKYNVIGKDDGKTYNANWIGKPKTGLYKNAALFAETGSEIIIDPGTTRNIVTNYPEILTAIKNARVNQYNEGLNMPQATENNQQANLENQILNETLTKLLFVMDKMLQDGVNAKIYMNEFSKTMESYSALKSKASRK